MKQKQKAVLDIVQISLQMHVSILQEK